MLLLALLEKTFTMKHLDFPAEGENNDLKR